VKRIFIFVVVMFFAIALVGAAIGWAAYERDASRSQSLSKYIPAGSLLYLEAHDVSSLLADWNSSAEKKQWVASSNYQVFSRSRLFLRLQAASEQFAAAAGIPPDMNFVSQVAGSRSAVALYDIGNLEFLYVTYLPSARSAQTALWKTRAKFEPRSLGGTNFYVRRDPESQKEVAFAISGDYLLLATREDLLVAGLQLMAESSNEAGAEKKRGNRRSIESESWWSQSVAAAGTAGDIRMVLNLEKIVPSPFFRSYWAQQNISDMKQYAAAVSDLFRDKKLYREERVLIRKNAPTPTEMSAEGMQAAADLVHLAPEGTGIYLAKAYPSAASCFELLETKLLAPHLGPSPPSEVAPQVQLSSGETGTESDFETRIDQPAAHVATQKGSSLKDLLDKTQILASLELQSSEREQSTVFVRFHTAVALVAASDWNEAAVQSSLVDFVRPSLTAGELGTMWQQKNGYSELDGLWPLAASVRGKYLLIADDPAVIEAMLSSFNRQTNRKPARFVAGFNHQAERSNFARLSRVVDRSNLAQSNFPGTIPGPDPSIDRQPQFFSENMLSLSSALADVSAETITVHAEGDKVFQTVIYDWSQ
jgi:hypothetical protein